jgi:excisionase family DNA binding protein
MQPSVSSSALLLSPRDTAKALSISTRKLWEMTAAGEIPHLKVGRLTRYSVESLQAWLAEREQLGR